MQDQPVHILCEDEIPSSHVSSSLVKSICVAQLNTYLLRTLLSSHNTSFFELAAVSLSKAKRKGEFMQD